jgi:hypothetical protein
MLPAPILSTLRVGIVHDQKEGIGFGSNRKNDQWQKIQGGGV